MSYLLPQKAVGVVTCGKCKNTINKCDSYVGEENDITYYCKNKCNIFKTLSEDITLPDGRDLEKYSYTAYDPKSFTFINADIPIKKLLQIVGYEPGQYIIDDIIYDLRYSDSWCVDNFEYNENNSRIVAYDIKLGKYIDTDMTLKKFSQLVPHGKTSCEIDGIIYDLKLIIN